MIGRKTKPFWYWIIFYLRTSIIRGIVSVAISIRGAELVGNSLLAVGLEWRDCKRCKKHFTFTTQAHYDYCEWCDECIAWYKCIECDRRVYVDTTKKVKVYEALFCEFCMPDAPKQIIEANQMLIDFKKVRGFSSDNHKDYDAIHEKNKESYAGKMSRYEATTKEQMDAGYNIPPPQSLPMSIYKKSETSPHSADIAEMMKRASSGQFFVKTESLDDLVGKNYNAPPIEVKHADLERIDSDSPHKSMCPVCKKGFLLMQRHSDTFLLTNGDNCILCGQRFEYTDVPDNKLTSL